MHSIRCGQLDAIVMPEKPLDILAQQLVAEVSAQVHDRGRDDSALATRPKSSAPVAATNSLWDTGAGLQDEASGGASEEVPEDAAAADAPATKEIFQPLATALAAMRTGAATKLSPPAKPASPEVRKAAPAAARSGLRAPRWRLSPSAPTTKPKIRPTTKSKTKSKTKPTTKPR